MKGRDLNDAHVARLRMLRDIAVPFAQEMANAGRLDFNVFRDRSGTRRCLLGWMATLTAFQADGWSVGLGGLPRWCDGDGRSWTDYHAAIQYFGIDWSQTVGMFGVDRAGSKVGSRWPTLPERAELIDAVLDEKGRR